jgi:hypothetical protein
MTDPRQPDAAASSFSMDSLCAIMEDLLTHRKTLLRGSGDRSASFFCPVTARNRGGKPPFQGYTSCGAYLIGSNLFGVCHSCSAARAMNTGPVFVRLHIEHNLAVTLQRLGCNSSLPWRSGLRHAQISQIEKLCLVIGPVPTTSQFNICVYGGAKMRGSLYFGL